MLSQTLWQISFALFATFHNVMFVLFAFSIFRLFTAQRSPYSAYYVGVYSFANALYGGCPLMEIQNYIALKAGAPLGIIGLAYESFGIFALVIRIFLISASFILIYVAYSDWNRLSQPVKWNNIISKGIVQSNS